jgi:hypothetical protein
MKAKVISAAALSALLLLGAGCSSNSNSSGSGSSASPTAALDTVQACTAAGQVWLVVSDAQGTTYTNQCVGNPKTGTAALENAGLKITRDSSGIICQIGNTPAQCPASFDGNFWGFYTAKVGGSWQFATEGSDTLVPAAGSIEGWCYGQTCTPPTLDGAVSQPSATPGTDASDTNASPAAANS